MSNFTHLHLHTIYSTRDSLIDPSNLFIKLKELKFDSVAITEHGNMNSHYEVYKLSKNYNIKILYGMEGYLAYGNMEENNPIPESETGKQFNYHILFIAKNKQGYENLKRISYIAYKNGMYYKPRVDLKTINKYKEGIICTQACIAGYIARAVLNDNIDEAVKRINELKSIFGEDYYLEVSRHGLEEQEKVYEAFINLGYDTSTKVIATNDVHYIKQEDARVHSAIMAKQFNVTLEELYEDRKHNDQEYLKSEEEMSQLFNDTPELIINTQEIVDKCKSFDILYQPRKRFFFPYFDINKSEIEI